MTGARRRRRVARLLTSIGSRFRFWVPTITSTALRASQDLRAFLLRDAAGDRDERPVPGLELH